MILLLDVGNTHTHLGLANDQRVLRRGRFPTSYFASDRAEAPLKDFVRRSRVEGSAWCGVVPSVRKVVHEHLNRLSPTPPGELDHRSVVGVGIDYPRPETIGPDRLANAVAVKALFGAPSVAVDFGTAVTFDVIDARGLYVGGIIAPGLSAMTDYLHEKTALLPRISIKRVRRLVGRSTEEAMRVGAVEGYRCLVEGLLVGIRRELGVRRLPVVATGGCAELVAGDLSCVRAVRSDLTLEGLRRFWHSRDERGREP